jgi:hypothetical protein
MKQLSKLTLSMACLFVVSMGTLAALSIDNHKCTDPQCAYERRDPRSGTTMHFDRYGNLLGRTKP